MGGNFPSLFQVRQTLFITASKAPCLTLRVATPWGAPREAPLEWDFGPLISGFSKHAFREVPFGFRRYTVPGATLADPSPMPQVKCRALGPFCGSYIARFSLARNPAELDGAGEFTEVEGQMQSSAWCQGLNCQHFYFSHRPSPLLGGRRLSGSWRGSVLSRFSVGFSSALVIFDRN